MGVGIAAGPHCRRCWHAGFPAPALTRVLPLFPALWTHPFEQGSSGPLCRFGPSCKQVLPVRLSLRSCGACWFGPHGPGSRWCRCRLLRVAALRAAAGVFPSSLLRAPLPRAPRLRALPSDGPSRRSKKGPSARVWRAAPRAASAGSCPRSCDHRPCRIRLASGRHSGIRNRSFRSAIRPLQSAPQHAGTGFNANFSIRSDQKISAFRSAPCGSFFKLRFPFDKTDAAPRS